MLTAVTWTATNMAEEQELLRLEALGKQFYETTDPIARSEAETALVNFANLQDCLGKCQLLLERGTSPYAQLIAATTLTKLIGRTTVALPLHQRIDIRNYLLNYLATRPKLPTFVTQALVQLFARITKLGWFDSDKDRFVFRDVTEDVATLLQGGSPQHIMLGVQIFSQVVTEMNQISESEANRSIMRHRKIASSFRDTQLFEIFQISCNLLKDANTNLKNINLNDPHQHGLLCSCLQLAQNCLTFDFIGTSTDESSDDLCTVQIPTCWRTIFLDFTILDLFFDLYKNLPPSLAALALGCLVQISSVRRSLFNNPERSLFLNRLVSGVQAILENPQGLLSDPSCYHEFCRLLARLKSNYQLGELVKVDSYPAVIKLIAEFTITSLQEFICDTNMYSYHKIHVSVWGEMAVMHRTRWMCQSFEVWHFAPNSIHYLLSLWQRLVASMPYVKANEPHMLETYTPEVTKAYITSRLTSVGRILRDGLEDPLDDWGTVSQQLDQLSTIGRCEYEKTCALLVQLFDESAQRYQELLARAAPNSNDIELSTQEGILSWLVYVIGAVIGGRISFASTDEHDAMDGELACRVLQLMNLVDSRLMQRRCEKLDLAILSFFEQFRKIYIGEQVQKTSKVYKRLMDVLGLHEESMVLSVYIRKIITNLKYWSSSEAIVSRTLQLLSDLSVGYSSVRKLVKLDTVLFILSNHTSEHFPFLGIAGMSTVTDSRCRTTLYTALGRLLMVDLGEDEAKFESFMIPITNSFEALGQMLTNVDTPLFRSDDCKKSLVGLARDLRGIAYAFNTKVSYMMLYDWLYPPYMPMLLRAVELWYHDPAVTTPVLKLMCELAQNRAQRLQFEVSSPNGILLFREISKLMVAYGSRILTLTNLPKEQVYPLKLKGIAICFNMLKAALCGNYVNFGVFRLYGDTALDSALAMFVKMLLSVSQGDLLDYPKLGQSYYALTECLAQDHITFVCSLEPQVFLYILSTISDGLSALDTMVSTGCCSILDNIVTYLFKKVTKKQSKSISSSSAVTADGQGFLRILEMHPEILQQMLSTVLNIIMFEDCRNQWSMSRPLLGLILLNEEYFAKLRRSIIENQPAGEKQLVMEQCFNTLMDGIEYSLLSKNRDRFTQNLSKFRHDVNDSVRGQQGGGDANGGDTVVANVDMML